MTQSLNKIPREKAYFIVGFSDGFGCFNTSFQKREDFLLGWKITPVFIISQKQRDILALIKRYLNCGTIRFRNDKVWVYQVDNLTALHEHIIPFFNKYPFLSQKKKADFQRFKKILEILERHTSTTFNDLIEILNNLDGIESESKRKYTNQEILDRAELLWKKNQEKIEKLNSKINNPQRLHAKHSNQFGIEI